MCLKRAQRDILSSERYLTPVFLKLWHVGESLGELAESGNYYASSLAILTWYI